MVQPAEERKATAARLGSYEILHRFAVGGMAELYLAKSMGPHGFEKLVVLKKILPAFAANARFVQLFLDEARLAATLDHPNIAHVYDLGTVEGNYFFTMEHVHGRDLRALLHRSLKRGTPLPIEHAVHVAREIAAALHYAHERAGPDGKTLGIVHRDVSPANVLVSYEGTVKLVDFGVAKAASSSVKTRTGSLKGKVSYMSPEQAKGMAIDRRSDLFSLGIVLWEMLAMRRLFRGGNDLATIQLIINEPIVAPSSVRPGIPPELDRIALRALARDADARYANAQDLQRDLEELAREHKLNQSSIALASQVTTLFGDEIDAWKRAQSAGVSLAQHLMSSDANDALTPGEFAREPDEPDGDPSHDVEADAETTEKREAPTPPTTSTTTEPAPAAEAQPEKKRKKRRRDYAIAKEPSIVLEAGLAEVSQISQGQPAPAPRAPSLPRLGPQAGVATEIMSAVLPPDDEPAPSTEVRRGPWPFVAGGGALVAAAAIAFLLASRGTHPETKQVEQPQPQLQLQPQPDPQPQPQPDPQPQPQPQPDPQLQPQPSPQLSPPPDPQPHLQPLPEPPPQPQPPPTAHPAHHTFHHRAPAPRPVAPPPEPAAKPPAAKFDPNAALPPM